MRDSTSSSSWKLGRALAILFVLAAAILVQQAVKPKLPYYWSNLRNLHRPLQFHGEHIHNNFFEGWYYKFTNNGSTHTMAVIAGVYHPPNQRHSVQQNHTHAFVMVLGLEAPAPSAYYRFSRKEFVDLSNRASDHKSEFKVRIGNSVFAHDELIIDLPVSHYDKISAQELDAFYNTASQQYLQQFQNSTEAQLRPLTVEYFRSLFPSRQELALQDQKAFAIKAHFQFPASAQTPLPTSWLLPSIMGTTAYLPFLECIHGVASLHHPIQRGEIATLSENDNILSEASYDGGVGYLEKDWGVNFPSIWIWAQTNVFKIAPGSSMLVRKKKRSWNYLEVSTGASDLTLFLWLLVLSCVNPCTRSRLFRLGQRPFAICLRNDRVAWHAPGVLPCTIQDTIQFFHLCGDSETTLCQGDYGYRQGHSDYLLQSYDSGSQLVRSCTGGQYHPDDRRWHPAADA